MWLTFGQIRDKYCLTHSHVCAVCSRAGNRRVFKVKGKPVPEVKYNSVEIVPLIDKLRESIKNNKNKY